MRVISINHTDMESESIHRLTDAQKDCLRLLWHDRLKIAGIAHRLQISEDTVDQRLRRARTILGVGSSLAAAELLAEHERGLSLSPVYPPSDIPPATDVPQDEPAYEGTGGGLRLPLPRRNGEPNNLGTGQRLFWIFVLTIAAILGMFLAMSMGEVITRLFLLWR